VFFSSATRTPCAGVGGAVIAVLQLAVAASASHSSRTAAGSIDRYAVRQVTTWIRAISAASSGKAGRTDASAVPEARGNGDEESTRAA
jgi:hypothetical protein